MRGEENKTCLSLRKGKKKKVKKNLEGFGAATEIILTT